METIFFKFNISMSQLSFVKNAEIRRASCPPNTNSKQRISKNVSIYFLERLEVVST